jgi:2-polyprenyl-6-methoxyphenol hydroxylase-like FAD-dependent oxidoreductase
MEGGRVVAAASDGRLHFADGSESPRFDIVIDALGARSVLSPGQPKPLAYGALWANLDWVDGFNAEALEQRYLEARKMAGVMPVGRLPGADRRQAAFFWSLKHSDRCGWEKTPLDRWKDDVLALWPATAPLLNQIANHSDLAFASYAHRTLASPLSRHVVHVGDSWHCTSPQLGQGANMALLDALALARALEWQSDLSTALGEYARLRLWHIRLYQAASWLFTPAYQSDSRAFAWFRDQIMAPVSRIPPAPRILAALVAGQICAPLTALRG